MVTATAAATATAKATAAATATATASEKATATATATATTTLKAILKLMEDFNMNNVINYAKHLQASDEVLTWLGTAGQKALKKQQTTETTLEHIIDYLCSPAAPKRLRKMSYEQANRKAKEWSEANQKKGRNLVDTDKDISTIHDFEDGSKIVKLLTANALRREGYLMSHCVGTYVADSDSYEIYSYRDSKNMPHATFEVAKNGNEIMQIKGKGNGAIHPKYIHPILTFLRSINCEPRVSEMKNLGYYHIPDEHKEFIKEKFGEKAITYINGIAYVY